MAHPITQHPPPTIPFPSAPRPSPIGFGFGLPSAGPSLSFGTPSRLPFGTPSIASSSTSFGFASATPTPNNGGLSGNLSLAGTGSPKRSFARPGVSPSPSAFRSNTAPASSLKRARRSPSPTPSSSPSPNSSTIPSPATTHSDLPRKEKGDGLSVGSLALKEEGERRRIVRKDVKRLRKDVTQSGASSQPANGEDVDVGVLLAALPPSAHLNILMSLLSVHPELKQEVMAKLPQPDQNECLAQLDKHMEKVRRHTGSLGVQLNPERVWTRAQKDVQGYIHIASTYLTFFSSSFGARSSDPQIAQTLLHALSTQIIYLLRLIPPTSDVNSGTTSVLLELGKRVITSWTSWLQALSIEVNQRSGMYPHSTVEVWASNLDSLANASTTTQPSTPTFGWTMPQQHSESSHALVDSYRDAMKPIRDRFVNELGWLIGRHPIPSAFNPSNMPNLPAASSWNTSSNMKMDDDEEL